MMSEVRTGPNYRSRKPIVLIGAPSGAGKTVLSQRIIAGEVPLFAELCGSAPDGNPIRYDMKTLPDDPPRDQIVIIECSTHKFEQFTRTEQWRRTLALVQESEQVIFVNLDVPRRTVVRQYFLRIFTGPKRMHVLYRVLQVSKYRNTLIYVLTRQLSRANAAWRQFGRRLAEEMSPRDAVVYARRNGDGYRLHLEGPPHEVRRHCSADPARSYAWGFSNTPK